MSQPLKLFINIRQLGFLKERSDQWFPLHYRCWKYEPEISITKKEDAQYSLQLAQSFLTYEELHHYMQVKMQNSWIKCKQLTLSCCLNSRRIFLLFKEGCRNLTLPAELCCNNRYCCISQIFPNSEGSMYHRGHPFTYGKKLFWWQKSPNTLLLLFNSEVLWWCYTLIPRAICLYENGSNHESGWSTSFKSYF